MIFIVKIIIIVSITNREPFNYKRRQLRTTSPPLFLRISLYKLRVYFSAYKTYSLFLQILGSFRYFFSLLVNYAFRLRRKSDSEHFGKSIHVKRHIIYLAFIIGDRRIYKIIKFREMIYIFPNPLVRSMKYMSPIFMNRYSLDFFGINISAQMFSLFNNKTSLALRGCPLRENGTEKTAPDYQIIIFFH